MILNVKNANIVDIIIDVTTIISIYKTIIKKIFFLFEPTKFNILNNLSYSLIDILIELDKKPIDDKNNTIVNITTIANVILAFLIILS